MRDDQYNLGKVPPQAIDLEMAVLGALLLEPEAIYKVEAKLRPGTFYKEAHQYIYQAILNLNSNSQPIDMMTTVVELKKMGKLEDIGGYSYITELTSLVAAAYHIEEHAKELRIHYIKRKFINISSEIMNMAYNESIDVDELYSRTSDYNLSNFIDGSDDIKSLKDNLLSAVGKIREEVVKFKETGVIGVPTPIPSLNDIIGGIENTWIVVIAARPGQGKTQLALSFAKHQSKCGLNPAFFALEMSLLSLSKRLLLAESGVPQDRMIKRTLIQEDFDDLDKAAVTLGNHNIWIDDDAGNSPASIKRKCIELHRSGKCDVGYVDYLQIANMTDIKGESGDKRTGEAMRIFRTVAKELDIPMIVLSQLNRKVEDTTHKRPNMSHLRDSGSIEQDADLILMPWRPSYYDLTEDKDGIAYPENFIELIMAKFRHGSAKNVECLHNETLTNFIDYNGYNPNISPDLDFHGDQPFTSTNNDEATFTSREIDFERE